MFRRYKRSVVLAKTMVPLDSDYFELRPKKITKHFTIVTYAADCADFETRKMAIFYPNTFLAAFHAENLVGGGIAMKRIRHTFNINATQIVGNTIFFLLILTGVLSVGFSVAALLTERLFYERLAFGSIAAFIMSLIVTKKSISILKTRDMSNTKVPNIFIGFMQLCVATCIVLTPESISIKFMRKNLPELD